MRNRMRALAVVSLSFAALQAGAQVTSPKLILQGTNATEVPLEATSSVTVNANGDLQAQCRGGTCPLGGGGGAVSATLTPSATEVTTSTAFSLSWTSTGADVCRGVGPTSMSGWIDQLLPTSGTRNVSPPAGEHVFSIRCYGVGGSQIHSTATVTVTQGGGQTGANYCAEYYGPSGQFPVPSHESFTAYGLQKIEINYTSIFDVLPGESQSVKKVLPGNWLSPVAGRYLAIPFVMTSETDGNLANLDMNWIEGGSAGSALIPPVSSGPIAFSVSPCPGDFRKNNISSPDRYERSLCRRTSPAPNGSLRITSDPNTQQGSCYVPIGKIMYLNVAAYNLSGTTLPTNTTCGSASTCGVSIQID